MMRAAGVEPLEEFATTRSPWPCRCDRCGNVCSPRLANVLAGQRACRYCAGRLDPAMAVERMKAAGLQPLEPYPGIHASWSVRCTVCHAHLTVRYASVIKRGQPGCPGCAAKPGRSQGEVAAEMMRAAGLEPLEDYPGVDRPWRSRCMNCAAESTPRLKNVRRGRSCRYCKEAGVDHTAAAVVYVACHPRYQVVKIGIANDRSRPAQLEAAGWQLHDELAVETGAEAFAVERAVLSSWRRGGLLPPLTPADLPGRGWTETVAADEVSAARAWADVQEAATLLKNREVAGR